MEFGTGALFRPPQPKDFALANLPEVADQLAAGLPSAFMTMPMDKVETIYNQGAESSCVAYSTCGVKSIEDFLDLGQWQTYDGGELYRANGGTGNNGVYTDRVLEYARTVGCKLLGGEARFKILNYLFAPQVAGAWRQTVAAATIASGPCVIATTLPPVFGWDSSGPGNKASYHQMLVFGYEGLGDSDHVVLLNSWGRGWGNGGFCRLTWGFLEGNGFQDKYVYAYRVTDIDDPNPEPPIPLPEPDPTVRPVISGVKYKARKKLFVKGTGFHSEAVISIDTVPQKTKRKGDRLVVQKIQIASGSHLIRVGNPEATSEPFEINV